MIHRTKHTKNYTVVQNTVLEDTRLSWKARGLMAYLLSKPNDWRVIAKHLEAQSAKDGREAVASALVELEACGYVKRTGLRTGGGQFGGYEYDIHETPGGTVSDNPRRHRDGLAVTGKPASSKYSETPRTDLLNTEGIINVHERAAGLRAALWRTSPGITLKVPSPVI